MKKEFLEIVAVSFVGGVFGVLVLWMMLFLIGDVSDLDKTETFYVGALGAMTVRLWRITKERNGK